MQTEALVEAALADRDQGFTAIYDAYADRIHDHCLSILRNEADAADAAQDTFVLAYERLEQLREPAKLTAWLYSIARSRCLRRIEGRQRQHPVDDMEPLTLATGDVSRPAEAQEARELVWAAAAGLADDDRAVLDAHLRHGLTGDDLAGVLGVSTRKATLMLHRMKERLERTVGAIVVLRAGRADCSQLATIAGDGDLTPLTRKRVARHIDGCDVCREHRRRLTPTLAYAAVALAPAPASLRDRVLERTASIGPAPSRATSSIEGEPAWRDDGFPTEPPRPEPAGPGGGPGRHARRVGAAGLVVVALLGGLAIGRTLDRSDADPVELATDESTSPTGSTIAASGGPETTIDPSAPSAPATVAPGAPGAPGGADDPMLDIDATAPTVVSASIECEAEITATVEIADETDPSPTASLRLTHDGAPMAPAGLERVGESNTFVASIARSDVGTGTITFEVRGDAFDATGNRRSVVANETCTLVD